MTVQQLIQFLQENPKYLKWSSSGLSIRLKSSIEDIKKARGIVRAQGYLKKKGIDDDGYNEVVKNTSAGNTNVNFSEDSDGNVNESLNENSIDEFNTYLKKINVKLDEVKSVKFWQTASGDIRYSIVTNNLQKDTFPDIDDIVSSLLKESEFIPLKKVFPKGEIPIGDKIMMVFLADKHIGADVSDLSIYSNPYSLQILQDRLEKVKREIIKTYLNMGGFKEIYLIDLGDALDGMNGKTVRGDHFLPQNLTNKEAFDGFISVHKDFYGSIIESGIAQKYNIVHLTDSNHGGDFEYFATRCLEEYMNLKYDSSVQFTVCPKFISHFSIGNHTYLFSHGKDMIDMKTGLPLNLDKKTEQYIMNYLIYHNIPLNNVHFIKGDLHLSNTNYGKYFRYRNISSMFGSSKWVMTNFGFSKAGCGFEVVDGDTVYQWDMTF